MLVDRSNKSESFFLQADVKRKIVEAVGLGASQRKICQLLGISRASLIRAFSELQEFKEAYDQARFNHLVGLLSKLDKFTHKSWQATVFALQAFHKVGRNDSGKYTQEQVVALVNEVLAVVEPAISPDRLPEVLDRVNSKFGTLKK
jgi:hypothetical protein